ncbi:MAG: amino acid permease [Actinobacteria bacterium]|nr:amino acid permease [Actinomycetota bacterium]
MDASSNEGSIVAEQGSASPPVQQIDEDTKRLHEMGYAQELNRSMSKFSNFAISFTIISILSGCLTLYQYGLYHGGPPVMIWGWLIVGTLVIFAGLSMAEICSAFPTAGGLYYWAAKLAPGKSAPIWSWFTGWFNLLGQVAVTAGISFGCSYSISAFIAIYTGDGNWQSPGHVIAILAVVLFVQGLLNTFGIRLVALLNDVSVWWHLIGVAVIVVVLYWAPASHSHQSASFLFGSEGWNAFKGLSGFSIPLYVFLIGLLNAQYTFTGYDASAHVTEETIQANISGAKGIVNSIWISMVAGFILLVGVSLAIPHLADFPFTTGGVTYTSFADLAANYVAWASIFEYAAGHTLALLLILIVVVAQFFCGMSSVTANSRMVYAFSRDGAVPFAEFWHKVSKRSRVPVRSAWFGAVGAFILAVPYLWNPYAYWAVTSIAVIGLYIAYLTPVFLRRINPGAFKPGPWVLGRYGPVVGWIAIIWVIFIVIVLMLPQFSPGTTLTTINFAPVAVLVVLGFAGLWYAVSARKWFKGPKIQGSAEELAEIERDLSL